MKIRASWQISLRKEYNFAMHRDQIIHLIQTNQAALQRYHVQSLALFGSAARDEM